jgi:iron(III) transport system permease protein
MLVIGSFRTSPLSSDASWTFGGYERAFSDPDTFSSLGSSLIYASAVVTCGMAIAIYLVTLATRVRSPLSRLLTPTMIVLAITPRLFYALAWGMLGSPNAGLIGRGLNSVGLASIAPWFNAYSWQGLIVVTTLKVTGLTYLLLLGPFRQADPAIEDAAVMSGVSRLRAFFSVTLPSLTPALLAIGMLTFVEVMQVFDLPAILGQPAGITTLSLHVYDYLVDADGSAYGAASAVSQLFILVIAVLLLAQQRITRHKDYVTLAGKAQARPRLDVGRWRVAIEASIVVFIVIALVLPVAQIVMGSFQTYLGVNQWTTRHYTAVFEYPSAIRTLLITLVFAVFGGLVAVAWSFSMAYMMRRYRDASSMLIRIASWVPAAAPGIVLSLALVWAYLMTPGIRELYGTSWLLVLALIVAMVPIAVRAIEGIIAQIGRDLEDAARISGAGFFSTVVGITGRLCAPNLLAAWLLVGLGISGILDVPLLFQSTGNQTVATMSFQFYNEGKMSLAAAMYCVYMVLILATVALIALGILGGRAARLRLARSVRSTTSMEGPSVAQR